MLALHQTRRRPRIRPILIAYAAMALACACSPSSVPVATESDGSAAAWKPVAEELRRVAPSRTTVVARSDFGFVETARALAPDIQMPALTERGFCYPAGCELEDKFADYSWILLDSMPDATRLDSIQKRATGGVFALIAPTLDRDLRGAFDNRFAVIHRRGFEGAEAELTLRFRGDKSLLDPLLDASSIAGLTSDAARSPVPAGAEPGPDDVLAARLRLSLDHLTANLDREHGDIPYFHGLFENGRWTRKHAAWDWCDLSGRYVLAIRQTAAELGLAPEAGSLAPLETAMLGTIRRDGLAYRAATDFSDVEADVFDQGSVLLALVDAYGRAHRAEDKQLIDTIIASLSAKSVPTPHGARFAFPTLLPDGSRGPGFDNWPTADPMHHGGRLLDPLARYLRLELKDRAARELFDRIAAFVVEDSGVFGADGAFEGHTHSRTNTLLGLLIRALDTRDEARVAFAQRSVDWFMGHTPTWGWFPEFLFADARSDERAERAETDTLADMIELLALLADRDDRYADALERYVRNGLPAAQWSAQSPDAGLTGSFCGYCRPNAWGDATMNCCSPAGALALVSARRWAVQSRGDHRLVRLVLDRDDADLRVVTEDRGGALAATITPKRSIRLAVRIPADVADEGWRCGRSATRKDRVLEVGTVGAGESVGFTFALPERTETARIGGIEYTYRWTGPIVRGVTPPGSGPGAFFGSGSPSSVGN